MKNKNHHHKKQIIIVSQGPAPTQQQESKTKAFFKGLGYVSGTFLVGGVAFAAKKKISDYYDEKRKKRKMEMEEQRHRHEMEMERLRQENRERTMKMRQETNVRTPTPNDCDQFFEFEEDAPESGQSLPSLFWVGGPFVRLGDIFTLNGVANAGKTHLLMQLVWSFVEGRSTQLCPVELDNASHDPFNVILYSSEQYRQDTEELYPDYPKDLLEIVGMENCQHLKTDVSLLLSDIRERLKNAFKRNNTFFVILDNITDLCPTINHDSKALTDGFKAIQAKAMNHGRVVTFINTIHSIKGSEKPSMADVSGDKRLTDLSMNLLSIYPTRYGNNIKALVPLKSKNKNITSEQSFLVRFSTSDPHVPFEYFRTETVSETWSDDKYNNQKASMSGKDLGKDEYEKVLDSMKSENRARDKEILDAIVSYSKEDMTERRKDEEVADLFSISVNRVRQFKSALYDADVLKKKK